MRGEDVSFRDVKIKIPDRNWDQGMWVMSRTGSVGWGFWDLRKSRVEFLRSNGKVEIQSCARPDEFVSYGCHALVGLRADDVKAVSIERLCLSLSACQKTFNSKVIKFCTWTNVVNFGFPMSSSHICISGYVTPGYAIFFWVSCFSDKSLLY